MTNDPYNLRRFVAAQDRAGTYDAAVAELRNGRKISHWMWFVFPQIAGLGRSATAVTYCHHVPGLKLRWSSGANVVSAV